MADAILKVDNKNEQTQKTASLEFNGKEYQILYTHIEYLKAMNVYGQIDKLKKVTQNNIFENCEKVIEGYDEAYRILKEMLGVVVLNEIYSVLNTIPDVDSVTQILSCCIEAISNRIAIEEKKKIRNEMKKLNNV